MRCIVESGTPHFGRVELLNYHQVVVEVVVEVYGHDVELAVLAYCKYLVVIVELAKVFAMVVEVYTQDIAVEPHLAAAER